MLRLKTKPGLLGGVTVALAGLLSLELFIPEPSDVRPQLAAWIAAQTQYLQARAVPAPQPTAAALSAIMLSRPLFAATRRPAAQPAQGPVAMPRLSGIMVTPTEKIAVFSPAMGAPIVVTQNSRFGAFTVLAITGDSVTIRGPGGVTVLGTDFGDRGQADPATPATPATTESTIVASGVPLSVIKVNLPKAINW